MVDRLPWGSWLSHELALCACSSPANAAPQDVDDGLVIEDVTLISPERARPLPPANVILRGGRIAQVADERIAGAHLRRIVVLRSAHGNGRRTPRHR